MAPTSIDVRRADELADPSPEDVRAANAFYNTMWAESDPEEPPYSKGVTEQFLRETWKGFEHRRWVARVDGDATIAGLARADLQTDGDNAHLARITLDVVPPQRRRGIATVLLRALIDDESCADRSLLGFATSDRTPAGEAFMRRIGAEEKSVERESECRLDEVDTDMIERWTSPPAEVTDRYELWRVTGAYPPEEYAAIAEVQNVMNTAPFDDLDFTGVQFTADHIAHREAEHNPELVTRWSHFIRDKSTGKLVGLTRVYLWRDWPGMVDQGDTAVDPQHRGHGLGKWLKGSIVKHLWEERPDARRIRTRNAYSNGPMLAINDALGFKITRTITDWQVPTETVRERL